MSILTNSAYLTEFRWVILVSNIFPNMTDHLEEVNAPCRGISEYGCKRFDQATVLLMKVCNEKA